MCNSCKSCQSKALKGMSSAFAAWTNAITRCSVPIFLISLGIFFYLTVGNRYEEEMDTSDFSWAPKDNQSVQDFNKARDFFVSSLAIWPIRLSFEAKKQDDSTQSPSLLTLAAFQEMIEFDNRLMKEINYKDTYYDDLCVTFQPNLDTFVDLVSAFEDQEQKYGESNSRLCYSQPKPIDFVYDRETDSYDLSPYRTDAELIRRLHQGTTQDYMYKQTDGILPIEEMFAQIEPSSFYQSAVTGKNNIEGAIAAIYDLQLSPAARYKDEYELEVIKWIEEFNEKSKHVSVGTFSFALFSDDLTEQLEKDTALVIYAAALIVSYCVLMIGSCSPIHCRLIVSLVGIVCIFLSVEAGFGWAYLLDLAKAEVHEALPILMLGIGVDDMFVIVNAVDQTSFDLTPAERIKQAMRHAGPSITITSVSNAMAFAAGSATSIIAVKSFCLFCCLTITLLYISMMTIFLCVLYWDTIRVHRRRGELCGLVFCAEDSPCFCRGALLSLPQQEFSKVGNWKERAQATEVETHSIEMTKRSRDTQDESVARGLQASKNTQPSSRRRRSSIASGAPKTYSAYRWRKSYKVDKSAAEKHRQLPEEHKVVVASKTERFLEVSVAPEIISPKGKVSIIFIYCLLTAIALNGCMRIETYYDYIDLFTTSDSYHNYEYEQADSKFDRDYQPSIYVKINQTQTQFYDEAAQLKYLVFEEEIQRCRNCTTQWFKPNTLDSWFGALREWVDTGSCVNATEGIDPFKKTLEPEVFKDCFNDWRRNNAVGKSYAGEVKMNRTDDTVLGFLATIDTIKIKNPGTNSIVYLDESRKIIREYGLDETFAFDKDYNNLEIYRVLVSETLLSLSLALTAVVIVVLFVTVNLTVTVLVIFVVLLVNIFMIGTVFYWGLTLNNAVTVNLSFGLGIALDYSTHIANMYLYVEAPKHLVTAKEQREYKARKAISMMGSSVFHGGFSTLMAISLLGISNIYTFQVFFKTWTPIIIFGMLNGIILLPILLSICGPVDHVKSKESKIKDEEKAIRKTDKIARKLKMKRQSIQFMGDSGRDSLAARKESSPDKSRTSQMN